MESHVAATEEEEYIDMELRCSPQLKEFEFQYLSTSTSTSAADELFYKGKLLPLHLPPRRQMLPYNISPSESCRASCDLNPSDALFEFSNHPRNTSSSSSKKLKINHSFLAHKLKSSTAYLKSFFTKSDLKYSRFGKKLATLIKKNEIDDHRRSFSGAISSADLSSTSSTASSSFNSHELHFLRRTSSAAEIEVSIDAAIAHCKKSMLDSSLSSSKCE
ncbi:probable membrane-associated kinase regulator 4 [Salvia miltiorrhiza]|uniref:probable membrane-associated kinase regulator 4 n=1 Tax=Salvia miltiorrhiza TaxID=226208 RepID=UPI0025AD5A06|nr:probable membrane-associated kinase regulator 4 [Salvia miltiorrhiza]